MRATRLLGSLCCLLSLTATSSRPPSVLRAWTPPLNSSLQPQRLAKPGERLFALGRYAEAAEAFQQALDAARKIGDVGLQARYLNNLGGCRLATFQYRQAMEAFLEAQRLTDVRRDPEAAAGIWSNIATAYTHMGEIGAARDAAERALRLVERKAEPNPRLLLRVATLRARTGDLSRSLPLFRHAIRLADRAGDENTLDQCWSTLGYSLLVAGQWGQAEQALLESFRRRRLRRAPDLLLSYRNLALLRMAQGDLRSASILTDRALALAERGVSPVPLWSLYHLRGRLRLREQRYEAALGDFRAALDLARRWRLEALPADAFRISLDVGLHELYASLLETAAELYFRTGRAELAREAFEAAEENRAASLRADLAEGGLTSLLPAAYGETLAQLHVAELAFLQDPRDDIRDQVQRLRRELIEMELRAGLERASLESFRWDARGRLLRRLQRTLRDGEAFLAFHLGDQAGYRWSVTREEFRMDRLPAREQLARRARAFSEAVRRDAPELEPLGRQLYEMLFAGLSPGVLSKPVWLLALDGAMFDLPLGALISGEEGGRALYLAQRHALQILATAHPSITRRDLRWEGPFVGVGDAIYNTADPRWVGNRRTEREYGFWRILPRLKAARSGRQDFELPRLPGSGQEIRACAAQWRSRWPAVLLEGAGASWAAVQQALNRPAAILHLATHVIAAPDHAPQVLIAMSLGEDGRAEMIGPSAVRAARRAADLVVLSGCASGRGPALPGAGLLGLTRAWLAAGAHAVIAGLWPVPDDDGAFFRSFYRHLGETLSAASAAPALALQRAQTEMLLSGNWRARPQCWSGYFVVGWP